MIRRSRRTAPALVVALVLLAAGALVATAAIQTLSDYRPVFTFEAVTGALSGVAWGSGIVVIVAAVAAVVGVLLVGAAIVPGASHVLPLAAAPAEAWNGSAGWHRTDLSTRLRRRAVAVEGVDRATVRVRRNRIRVSARTHRGTTADLREVLTADLSADLDALALARRPRLRVTVTSTRKEP
ncbi:DUF6286 domain-containing protein [Actinomycetospora atypica]|uniref:DUF6286 domain-containing protein n=1 Tax=Actinomycetospora atypica TaxID=1290095 RepID=A0ABV9YH62_9PSEU